MYGDFAAIYEKLQDIDYEAYADYIEKIFEKEGISPELVLDLACGTGTLTTIMAKRGYDMIGIDMSFEMLDIAREKMYDEELDILYLNQDMTEFELYGTVDAIICSLDGVNYLTEDGDLLKTLKLVKNYLNPGGIMVFDINSEYKLSKVLGNNTFVTEEKDIFYVWQNEYDEKSKICYFNLDFFEKQGDKYVRYTEEQAERAYSENEIRTAAEDAVLKVMGFYSEFSFDVPSDTTQRCFVVLKK
ncbi:MAG: class I SAM-dependent methyltransferase [Ruminococcaceae bacterium]|nr:class I SAM-dependent methyltransferase [Oscillospiraceae bacterium]